MILAAFPGPFEKLAFQTGLGTRLGYNLIGIVLDQRKNNVWTKNTVYISSSELSLFSVPRAYQAAEDIEAIISS